MLKKIKNKKKKKIQIIDNNKKLTGFWDPSKSLEHNISTGAYSLYF